ncbi:MAG TPA: M14 family zinc carboxypeptidase, partial [Polyangia bacterium]|nr:M14 family zinc carboxypeptidase [Polyangia bacterium]
MTGQAGSLQPLAPYPSPEERTQAFAALIERARGEVLSYGASVEGRPLLAGRLPQRGADAQPHARVLAAANIHGVEYVSTQVVLGLAEAIDQLDTLRRLRARAEVWLIPSLNPDAYARVWEAG